MLWWMRALLAEYATFHDPALAPEGKAMCRAVAESLGRCGYETVFPDLEGIFMDEIHRLAPGCEIGLVIAPDHLLAGYTRALEEGTNSIGCGSMNVALCANKRLSGRVLASHGIPVPPGVTSGRWVVKPVNGCGAQGVRITDRPAAPGEFAQEFIDGEHLSVSLIGSRVVGDACLSYSGARPLVLAINSQEIRIDDDGRFHYAGGETPVEHERSDEIAETGRRCVEILGCQGYIGIDVVVADQVYVVDVNPRITTSLVGIAACMEEEIAALLIGASRGILPASVHLQGKVRFNRQGVVERQ
jgi:predicted ATP-grasp superfamily ATP-dependent carboligase